MPRTLARLQFRAPKPHKPLNLSKIRPGNQRAIEREITNHVLQLSKPETPLNLSVVTDPKWKLQPAHRTKNLQYKPHTLRDIVDPECERKHGETIYVFRNTKTNQVIYSFSELLDQYHLEQLPFMGRGSKPPSLRPDEWIPHCVVFFPSSVQGHHAFRRLREYRKLHELSWDKTNRGWRNIPKNIRMKKLMDQVANTSADLAAVLTTQANQSERATKAKRKEKRDVREFMDKKWAEITELAEASQAKEPKDGDNIKWLEGQVKSLTRQQDKKSNQNEQDKRRLAAAIQAHQVRIKNIRYAQRKVEQLKIMQANLSKQATLVADVPAAEKRLCEEETNLREEETKLRQLEKRILAGSSKLLSKAVVDARSSALLKQREIEQLKAALKAKKELDTGDHHVARTVLPPQKFNKKLPEPFSTNVKIKWADINDAMHASGKWPPTVVQDILPVKRAKEKVTYMNQAQYNQAVEDEVAGMISGMEKKARRRIEAEERRLSKVIAEPKSGGGVMSYLAKANPFKKLMA